MKLLRLFCLALAALCLGASPGTTRQKLRDGDLIAKEACSPRTRDYAEWLANQEEEYAAEKKFSLAHRVTPRPFGELRASLQTADEFRRRRAYDGFTCERLTYASDGLKVVAYVWRPADVHGKHLPLVIFNRAAVRISASSSLGSTTASSISSRAGLS